MGKKGKLLSTLKKAFNSESKGKKKQANVHLDPTGSDAATLETGKLSHQVEFIEPKIEHGKQTCPVAVPTVADKVGPAKVDVEVVRCQLDTDARFVGKSMEEMAAIKIQTAFRVYLAKRALCALRGLVRLKSIMQGPVIKRQAADALLCIQTLSRVQCQIHARRIRMVEENRAARKQLLQKHAKQLVNLQTGEDWDDSVQSKEQIEASLLSKHEASMRRERAMAYSFTHQQIRKTGSRSMNPLFMDTNNPSWGWSWMERMMAARPWEVRGGTIGKEQNNDQSSVKNAGTNFGGEISNAYARYQLNFDKQSPTTSQKPIRKSSLLSPSTPRKPKLSSPRSIMFRPDEDTRSIVSMQSERNRRHSIVGSSLRDDESLANYPSRPSYTVPTKSARAKTKLHSPLGLEANGMYEKEPIASAKKRLSYPPSSARPRRHSGPSKVDISITNTEVAPVKSEGL